MNSQQEVKQSGVFYGWYIVVLGFLASVLLMGVYYSYAVFFVPLMIDFQATAAAIGFIASIMGIAYAVFSLIGGLTLDKWGPRVVNLICGIMMGSGLILASRATSVVQLNIFLGVFIGGGIGIAIPTWYATVARWFMKKRGFATGLFALGSGAGVMIIAPIVQKIVDTSGWRTAMLVFGIVSLIYILLAAFLVRKDPSEKGLLPLGMTQEQAKAVAHIHPVLRGMSVKQAMSTVAFWLFFAAMIIELYIVSLMSVHLVSFATLKGMSATTAALMLTVMGAFLIVGQFGGGALADRFNKKKLLVLVAVIHLIGQTIFLTAPGTSLIPVGIILFSLAEGMAIPLISTLMAQIFGLKKMGTLFSIIMTSSAIGVGLGPWVAGRILDTTGSYSYVFIVNMIASAVMAIIFLLMRVPKVAPIPASTEKAVSN